MVFLTADTHGTMDIHKLGASAFVKGKELTKDDLLIILGDFGLLWKNEPDKEEIYWTEWLSDKEWTTLVVDGNHENFNRIYSLPEVEMFGSVVRKCSSSIYFLKRGNIYNIEDNIIFTMGGAYSIDKLHRKENISWWSQEIPSVAEFENGLSNLEKYNWEVDYILGHTCPNKIGKVYLNSLGLELFNRDGKLDSVGEYFNEVTSRTKFKQFYFGHYHDNITIQEKYIMLYESIVKLGETPEHCDYNKK